MGTLYIIATPIGNLEDISFRALRILFETPILLCEDTREAGQLLKLLSERFGNCIHDSSNRPILMRYDNQKEHVVTPEIIAKLESGNNIALVSDAGTPLVSDPGYVLVSEARKRGISVVSIPGSSALITALTSSGLPTNTFTFLGYPPEKKSRRMALFQHLASTHQLLESTYIFYVAPHKLLSTLIDMQTIFGDIDITIARELTKIHEDVWSGSITHAATRYASPKGEFVLLFTLK